MSFYRTQIKAIHELTEDSRHLVVCLYLKYYEGSTETQVLQDLSDKQKVILLWYDDTIVGFTSLQIYQREWLNREIRVVYSGDTLVDRKHWGQQALAYAWISLMSQIKYEQPDLPLYWFVIIKGHRTFKYLPTFAESFYPHWSIDRSDLKPLADYLAREKFGEFYNSESGLVEFDKSRGNLKAEIAYPTEEEKNKSSVRFFLETNPNYLIGHELVCLCELEEHNMKSFTKRIFRKACDARALAAAV